MDRHPRAFWVAAAAVAHGGGALPPGARARWRQGLRGATDPALAAKIVESAFPDLETAPMEELAEVAWALIQKCLDGGFAAPPGAGASPAEALLAPLRPAAAARPGLPLFIAHCVVQVWSSAPPERQFPDAPSLCRAVDVLLWAAEAAGGGAAAAPAPLAALATALAGPGLLSDILARAGGLPLGHKLRALRLVGLCAAAAPVALLATWAGLDAALHAESNGPALHLAACALFGGLAAQAPGDPRWQGAAAEALGKGLRAGAAGIALPAALAAGAVLRDGRRGAGGGMWAPEVADRVAAAAAQALERLELSVGAWGAWRAPGAGGGDGEAVAAEEVPRAALAPQHVQAVLKLLRGEGLL